MQWNFNFIIQLSFHQNVLTHYLHSLKLNNGSLSLLVDLSTHRQRTILSEFHFLKYFFLKWGTSLRFTYIPWKLAPRLDECCASSMHCIEYFHLESFRWILFCTLLQNDIISVCLELSGSCWNDILLVWICPSISRIIRTIRQERPCRQRCFAVRCDHPNSTASCCPSLSSCYGYSEMRWNFLLLIRWDSEMNFYFLIFFIY